MANAGGVMVALSGFVLPLAIIGMPIEFTGMQKASNASVIELTPCRQGVFQPDAGRVRKPGVCYFQFPKAPRHREAPFRCRSSNPATGETTTFDFPANLTLPK